MSTTYILVKDLRQHVEVMDSGSNIYKVEYEVGTFTLIIINVPKWQTHEMN